MIAAMASPPDLVERLRALPAVAPLEGVLDEAWIVGGTVRDVLLGCGAEDIDLVVEGDAVAAARRLAAALGGRLVVHDRFGTATVTVAGHDYDLATARAERYPRPGALPEVRPGTIEEDMLRRDFTVNAIAVRLDGAVAAAPYAFEDLAARRLRVLHDASFSDDPTRLLRLVRYATRLGFDVEPRTRALADAALAGGALATVTAPRVGSELRLLLREPSALDALALVADWPGEPLGFPLTVDRALSERALALLPADGRPDLLLLAAAARSAAPARLRAALDALGFVARERDTVVAAAGAERLAWRLAEAARPSQVADAARRAPVEAVALAGALGGGAAEAAASTWLRELRHVRLEIDGGDLLAAGVPQGQAVGRGLSAALRARLDGVAPDRDAQLAVALAAAGARG